jgi:hypothetical protein
MLIGVRPAQAQGTAESPLFIDGNVFLGLEYRSRSIFSGTQTAETGQDASDQVLGGGFAIGTFLGSQVSARLEVAMLGETALRTESNIGSLERSIVDRYISSRTFSVLAGYHPPSTGRVRLVYVGGVAFIRLQEEFVQQLVREGIPPFIPSTVEVIEGKQVLYGPTVMVGMDAAVRLGRHVDVVPQIRVTSASGLSVRPGVSLRWRR